MVVIVVVVVAATDELAELFVLVFVFVLGKAILELFKSHRNCLELVKQPSI